jgi:hypothetical protein
MLYNVIRKGLAPFALLAVLGFAASGAFATPNPTGIIFNTRVFDDCPTSILTTTNNYPTLISIFDDKLDCGGYANLHNWRFSEDGATGAVFNNNSAFSVSADLVIYGTANGEAGLQIAPWWSQNVDGRFNVRSTDGEIACFGGRLPFYSFTATYGLNYVKGDVIGLEVTYLPHSLTEADPATIEYVVHYGGSTYTSGPLPFDEGNPAEPYGTWGMLDDGRVGGHLQCFLEAGNPDAGVTAEWHDVVFVNLDPVALESTTWGTLKSLYR